MRYLGWEAHLRNRLDRKDRQVCDMKGKKKKSTSCSQSYGYYMCNCHPKAYLCARHIIEVHAPEILQTFNITYKKMENDLKTSTKPTSHHHFPDGSPSAGTRAQSRLKQKQNN